MRRVLILILAAAAALLVPAGAAARVPQGFVGTDADGPLLSNDTSLFYNELPAMATAGIETIRINFDWRRIQPYRSMDQVPQDQRWAFTEVHGVPNDFWLTDTWMAMSAQRGISVMPVLIYTPRWARRHAGWAASPPRDRGDFVRFARTLVERYGQNGTFWSKFQGAVPYHPIQFWQIWNEPNFRDFWKDQPWAPDYVKLLKRTYTKVHETDPAARVVMAGLTNKSWNYLQQAYAAGAKGYFDYAAIHPFTHDPDGIVTILKKNRQVMRDNNDSSRPLMVTEMSWTSALNKTSQQFGFEETEKGQADKLAAAYKLLAKKRKDLKLRAVFWYTWLTKDQSKKQPFDYAGLNKLRSNGVVVRKPAYGAMRDTAVPLEGCTAKAGDASTCAR